MKFTIKPSALPRQLMCMQTDQIAASSDDIEMS